MKIEQHKHGAVTVVKPIGPLVGDETDEVKRCLADVGQRNMGRLLLDLSAVPIVDSRGLETFLDVNDQLAESGQSLKICGASEVVREVLELTELASSFELFADAQSAVRSFL